MWLELMLLAPRLHSENHCSKEQGLGCGVGGRKFLLLPFEFSFLSLNEGIVLFY